MTSAEQAESAVMKEVPSQISDSDILDFLYTKEVSWKHLNALKSLTEFSDEDISKLLNISVSALHEYSKPKSTLKENTQEHLLLLLALMKHGNQVFGSQKEFDDWLQKSNFYFDGKPPISFLNTITGIRFVDDRLTAMEHGDNV